MAFSLHNLCPCRVLCRVHTRLTTAPRIDASCTSTASLFALDPVLSYILLKRNFIRQASGQCQRALDPHTDWPTRCHCLFVAWLHRKCYCDSDSTKVATIQQPRRWPKRSSPLQDPRRRLRTSFFFNQPLPAMWALRDLVATFSDVCWSGLVSAGTPSFIIDPTTVTPALSSFSAQFDFRMLNAKSREERINLELRLCGVLLDQLCWADMIFFSSVLTRRERQRERERGRERERERESRQNLPLA